MKMIAQNAEKAQMADTISHFIKETPHNTHVFSVREV